MRREDLPYEAWKAWDSMPTDERELLGLPSFISPYCLCCGEKATNQHHVIQKGMGGRSKVIEDLIPTVSLCGFGNASGCHGFAHSGRLKIWYDGEWHAEKI